MAVNIKGGINLKKKPKEQIGWYALFLVGLFIASLGVAFSAKAGLGTSPVASVPYSISIVSQVMSFGWWLNLWSLMQIMVQISLLRRACKPLEILIQTILAFVYDYLTDFSCSLLAAITPASYLEQVFWMLVGCFVLALGIWIQYKGGVAMLPGEAMNRVISRVTRKRYENIKIAFDIVYIAVSAVICLIFTGKLQGVWEGSIVAALLVGNIIRMFNHLFGRFFGKKA